MQSIRLNRKVMQTKTIMLQKNQPLKDRSILVGPLSGSNKKI